MRAPRRSSALERADRKQQQPKPAGLAAPYAQLRARTPHAEISVPIPHASRGEQRADARIHGARRQLPERQRPLGALRSGEGGDVVEPAPRVGEARGRQARAVGVARRLQQAEGSVVLRGGRVARHVRAGRQRRVERRVALRGGEGGPAYDAQHRRGEGGAHRRGDGAGGGVVHCRRGSGSDGGGARARDSAHGCSRSGGGGGSGCSGGRRGCCRRLLLSDRLGLRLGARLLAGGGLALLRWLLLRALQGERNGEAGG